MAANTNPSPKPSACLQDMDDATKVFQKFDANGDGKISVTELVGVMKALGSDTSETDIKRTMEEIDADHDGFISHNEFTAFLRRRRRRGRCSGNEGRLRAVRSGQGRPHLRRRAPPDPEPPRREVLRPRLHRNDKFRRF
ncbi:calcium-binding EF-hand family protein [Actinidia rufa]|uniref:Calcium-binding EF-hand family protein n=1 Tax=Actinidia rufa TaxID=165716 RepID=A0A7J0GNB8_9ERIC|nr:calcium-binding EF-hand family protein [Actinidia rufa]